MRRRATHRLGELERAVLAHLWRCGASDVRRVHERVGQPRGLAPNTIQSTLERLHRKGLARRHKQGRAYVYAAASSRQDWLARALEELLEETPDLDGRTLVSAFVDVAERSDPEALEELARRIRERRKERR